MIMLNMSLCLKMPVAYITLIVFIYTTCHNPKNMEFEMMKSCVITTRAVNEMMIPTTKAPLTAPIKRWLRS